MMKRGTPCMPPAMFLRLHAIGAGVYSLHHTLWNALVVRVRQRLNQLLVLQPPPQRRPALMLFSLIGAPAVLANMGRWRGRTIRRPLWQIACTRTVSADSAWIIGNLSRYDEWVRWSRYIPPLGTRDAYKSQGVLQGRRQKPRWAC